MSTKDAQHARISVVLQSAEIERVRRLVRSAPLMRVSRCSKSARWGHRLCVILAGNVELVRHLESGHCIAPTRKCGMCEHVSCPRDQMAVIQGEVAERSKATRPGWCAIRETVSGGSNPSPLRQIKFGGPDLRGTCGGLKGRDRAQRGAVELLVPIPSATRDR
jgi:hypothetical protein